jgi:hypothetical protein
LGMNSDAILPFIIIRFEISFGLARASELKADRSRVADRSGSSSGVRS